VAERLLDGTALYEQNPRVGVWWPPFALAAILPFSLLAKLSLGVAKGAFVLASVAAFYSAILRMPVASWKVGALAIIAVAVPLQTNFEDLNLNAFLLALVVAAAIDLERGRATRAGVWIGLATALKVFPALLFGYLLYRRQWRAVAGGLGVAVVLTVTPLLADGPAGAWETLSGWVALTAEGGWSLRGSNQSLAALVDRLGGGRVVTYLLATVCLAALAVALRRPRDHFRDVALVTLVAVLLTPIAWVHYYLLALPAWAVAIQEAETRTRRVALAVAGFLTAGFYTVISYDVRHAAFELAPYTWGALVLLIVLCFSTTLLGPRPPGLGWREPQ
jgi:alpha-1,2-mannosyltransferase